MNLPKLPIVISLAVIAGLVAYLMMPAGGDAMDTRPGAEQHEEPAAPPRTEDAAAATDDVMVREAIASRAVTSRAAGAELDPALAVEMAGFRGRVLHHDGTPAADHRVVLYRFDPDVLIGQPEDLLDDRSIAPDVDAGDALTDAEGRFSLEGVWPRSVYLLHAGVGADNPTPMIIERTPSNREVVDLGDIVLRDGAVVTGTIVDEDGAPVSGAVIHVLDIPAQMLQMVPVDRFDPEGALIMRRADVGMEVVFEMPAWIKQRYEQLPIPTAISGEDGTFRVTGIPPGNNNSLLARHHGMLPGTRPGLSLKAGAEKDVGSVRMKLGEEVYGSVRDEAGEPIAGAEVLIGQGGMFGAVHVAGRSIRTAADGSFSASGFKTGKIVAAARRGSDQVWVITDDQSVMKDLDIVLPTGHDLTVRVTRAGGQHVGAAQLTLLPAPDRREALMMKRFGMTTPIITEEGPEALEDGQYRFKEVLAGNYVVLARAPGHAISSLSVEVAADTSATIELQPETQLTVFVTHRNGTPIGAASVYVEQRGERRMDVGNIPTLAGRTGSDGRLAVQGVPRGEIRLAVRHPRYGWVQEETEISGPTERHLTFDDPGAIEGVLTDGGELPEQGEWAIVSNRTGHVEAMPEMPRITTADAQGSFSITGLQPGEYRLDVIESLSKYTTIGAMMPNMGMTTTYTFGQEQPTVIVSAGQTAHVTLDANPGTAPIDGPAGQVSGTVMIDGMPAEGMLVTVYGERQLKVTVDASGHFDLRQVPAGYVSVQGHKIDGEANMFSVANGVMWQRHVQVEENGQHSVTVDLQTGGLTGDVIGHDGSPAVGAQVSLLSNNKEQGTAYFSAVSDEQGQFTFTGLPTGTYHLSAAHAALGSAAVQEIELGGGTHRCSVNLVATVTVKGHIDRKIFGEDPGHSWLTLNTESGPSGQSWSQIDEDGGFEFTNVIPGTYQVRAWVYYDDSPGKEFEYPSPLQIGATDINGLILPLREIKNEPRGPEARSNK